MEAHRGPYGSSALLPYELALINQCGLSVEEYREFQRLAAAYKAERKPGYEHIPDVRNEPVSTTLAIVSLVIGVASTAAALLMKPKPPEARGKREPTNFDGGDNVGKANFSPRYGFDSVQSLATLGQVIPLIFGHRSYFALANHVDPKHNDRIACGGVRVDTQLVWSALYSTGRAQELRIAALIGHSRLGSNPEYEGYAIGTTKLESVPQERVFLSFNKDGKRPEQSKSACKVYPESKLEIPENQPDDLLSVQVYDQKQDKQLWNLSTSGTFTPSGNRVFGLYNQIPNATAWMQPYSNLIVPNNNSNDDDIGAIATDASQDIQRLKLIKTLTAIPNGSAIIDKDDKDAWRENDGMVSVDKGDKIIYKIGDDLYGESDFSKEGSDDLNQAIQRKREDTESRLLIGEVYQIGNFKAKLIGVSPDKPLQPGIPMDKEYEFEALENGRYQIHRGYQSAWYRDSISAGNSGVTPWYSSLEDWKTPGPSDESDRAEWGNNATADCCLISAIEDAVVSNTRKCNVTEIGIKSSVYRRVNLPNVNAFPEEDVTDEIADTGGRLDLGTMDKYLPRYSFFRILVRKSGNGQKSLGNDQAGNPWQFLHGGVKFAVYGKTPEPQYNWIRIFHPAGEQDAYEFKLNPVPGWAIRQSLQSSTSNERIWLLDAKRNYAFGADRDGRDLWGGFSLVFGGQVVELTPQACEISEFDRGPIALSKRDTGVVVELDKYDNGRQRPAGWVLEEERYSDPSQRYPADQTIPRNKYIERLPGYSGRTQYEWMVFWDDVLIKSRLTDKDESTAPFIHQDKGKRYVCGPRQQKEIIGLMLTATRFKNGAWSMSLTPTSKDCIHLLTTKARATAARQESYQARV